MTSLLFFSGAPARMYSIWIRLHRLRFWLRWPIKWLLLLPILSQVDDGLTHLILPSVAFLQQRVQVLGAHIAHHLDLLLSDARDSGHRFSNVQH